MKSRGILACHGVLRPYAGWIHQTEEGSPEIRWFRKTNESQWRGLILSDDDIMDIYSLGQAYSLRWQPVQAWKVPGTHDFILSNLISYIGVYDIICYQIYKISNQWSHMSLIWYLGSWNFDITYTNLWYHMHYFIPYIKCLSHHMLELWYHIYEPMISDIWLHTLYHMFMKACVGTMIS